MGCYQASVLRKFVSRRVGHWVVAQRLSLQQCSFNLFSSVQHGTRLVGMSRLILQCYWDISRGGEGGRGNTAAELAEFMLALPWSST